jgi:hypothetical protein
LPLTTVNEAAAAKHKLRKLAGALERIAGLLDGVKR